MNFVTHIKNSFSSHANLDFANQMKAYTRNQFEFYGLKTATRRELLKASVSIYKTEIEAHILDITFELYSLPQRELHLCAAELFEKCFKKKYPLETISSIEKLITTNSWWDTVDYISKWILGNYLRQHPEQIQSTIERFSNHENMWLNRSTFLFQLGYKDKTDSQLLFKLCLQHKHSNYFFIQKAIGWSLREYYRVNPQAVIDFVNANKLAPLSKREALKHYKK